MGAVRAVNLGAVVILEELGNGGTVSLSKSKTYKKRYYKSCIMCRENFIKYLYFTEFSVAC